MVLAVELEEQEILRFLLLDVLLSLLLLVQVEQVVNH